MVKKNKHVWKGKNWGKKSNLREDKEMLSVEEGKIIGKYHGNILIT